MIPANATPDVQQAFREIQARLDTLFVENVDMHHRRLTNCGVSVGNLDYTTKLEVQRHIESITDRLRRIEDRLHALENP